MKVDRSEYREEDTLRLLADLEAGREGAESAIQPRLYEELRGLARRQMRGERKGHTLQTTALVHEAYLRLSGTDPSGWQNRTHFLRVAARAMRHVLVDHARRKRSDRQGGEWERVPLDAVTDLLEEASGDIVSLDNLLKKLAVVDERLARVVELRFFGGLSLRDTARVLGISLSTVKTDWTFAKAWLRDRMV